MSNETVVVSGTSRRPTHLIFLVDVSGSMDDRFARTRRQRISVARDVITELTANVDADALWGDTVSIYTFSGPGTLSPGYAFEVLRASRDRSSINRGLQSLAPRSGTPTCLLAALRELAAQYQGATILLVSDGTDAGCGTQDYTGTLAMLKARRLRVVTINVAGTVKADTLLAIANTTGGVYCSASPAGGVGSVATKVATLLSPEQDFSFKLSAHPAIPNVVISANVFAFGQNDFVAGRPCFRFSLANKGNGVAYLTSLSISPPNRVFFVGLPTRIAPGDSVSVKVCTDTEPRQLSPGEIVFAFRGCDDPIRVGVPFSGVID